MIRYRFIFAVLISFFTLFVNLNAHIINVPDDRNTIQNGINASDDGDTVLVQPGVYQENITFPNTSITVTSLFIFHENEFYIDSTIIEGAEDESAIVFDELGEAEIILNGFTITGNQTRSDGAGVRCTDSSPTLSNLKIIENSTGARGGGIALINESNAILNNVIIMNNEASLGGGIFICYSNPVIGKTLICNNSAEQIGGGIYCSYLAQPEVVNLTLSSNTAETANAIFLQSSDLSISNSILWGNEDEEINCQGECNINIEYSDLEESEDGIQDGAVEWGDGNIDEDPSFVNVDEQDYHLNEDSPCINTGNPESPDDLDGTRADMGALPYCFTSAVEGFVLDASDDSPLSEVLIYNQYGFSLVTDENGFFRFEWAINRELDLTATYPGYNDLTLFDLEVVEEETLRVVFRLTHPVFLLSEERIDATLNAGDSTNVDLTITNRGNGTLEWQARKRSQGGFDPWDLRQYFDVSDAVHDARVEGVVFADDRFYVSGSNNFNGNDGENMIYVLDRDGNEVNRFTQFGESTYGMKDLAWDGELIWGCDGEMVIGFTTDGDSVTSFEGPEGSLTVIAWDTDREVLWVARKTGNYIHAMNLEGEEVMSVPRYGLRFYGLTYWPDAPDDYKLYIYHSPDNETDIVHKINPENRDTVFVKVLDHVDGDSPRGCFITNQYDRRNTVFICVSDNGANDRINIWQLEGNTRWMDFQPFNGILEADSTEVMGITIRSAGFDPDIWEGEIVFNHNALGGETILPVTMTIVESAVNNHQNNLPSESGITSVYPNPFNSSVTIKYDLNTEAVFSLRLYDITGREIMALIDNENRSIGQYSIALNADNLPAGLYLLKLEAGLVFSVRKLVLMP